MTPSPEFIAGIVDEAIAHIEPGSRLLKEDPLTRRRRFAETAFRELRGEAGSREPELTDDD